MDVYRLAVQVSYYANIHVISFEWLACVVSWEWINVTIYATVSWWPWVVTLDSLPEGLGLVTGQICVWLFLLTNWDIHISKDKPSLACEVYLIPPPMLKSRSTFPTILLMTNVLRVTESAICSGFSHPCKWIMYPCLGGQEPESWTDWIWLLLKVASELMFHASIICIENSLECKLNTVLL